MCDDVLKWLDAYELALAELALEEPNLAELMQGFLNAQFRDAGWYKFEDDDG